MLSLSLNEIFNDSKLLFERLLIKCQIAIFKNWNNQTKEPFQSRDLQNQGTQEAHVCMYVCMSQKIIRFISMNSSVNSFLEWQKLLDIDESDYVLKKMIKNDLI